MNLILNRHLDRGQEQAIYELTLKKQRSKKSTISRKQVERMQQLASELMPQRKDLAELINELSTASGCCCRCGGDATVTNHHTTANNQNNNNNNNNTTLLNDGSHNQYQNRDNDYVCHDLCRCNSSSSTTTTTTSNEGTELQRQSSTSTIATNSTSSSASLAGQQQIGRPGGGCIQSSNCSSIATSGLEQETSIKVNQMRLEHLNNELKRRLNQYEYLVAQEKAILGAYNMAALHTNEGVNNFHLYHH